MVSGYQGLPPECGFSLPGNLDEIVNEGTAFALKKHDASTTVGIIEAGAFGLDRSLLVKRFNHRGLFDFLIHRAFNGRAKRLWNRNMRLFMKGLPVPEPLAYIEASLRQKNAFFVSSVVSGAESLSALHKKGVLAGNRALTTSIAAAIVRWHQAGAVHGDMKWPNILIRKDGGGYECFFVDLDQARLYDSPNIRGIRRDLERFYRFGLQLGAGEWVDKEFFPEYISLNPAASRAGICLNNIKENALREWIKKGREKS